MARRRRRGYRKSAFEARLERLTWGLLVLAFAFFQFVPPEAGVIPNWMIPITGAVILLGSGAIQYTLRMRVSPITWLGGLVLLMLGLYNAYVEPTQDFLGAALIVFAIVILFGVITNET